MIEKLPWPSPQARRGFSPTVVLVVAAFVVAVSAGVVLSPGTALANDDETTVPSEFRADQGDDSGRTGTGPGTDDGGLNADPNDWDVDSWDRGVIEPAPDPQPDTTDDVGMLDRWIGWMRSVFSVFWGDRSSNR